MTFALAFGILSVSFLRHSAPSIASNYILTDQVLGAKLPQIDYVMPYPGGIQPDNTLWYAKVMRDKIWYALTFDKLKKSSLNLLFSDKRLISAKELFDKKKPDLGISVLTKGEKYLETASQNLNDTDFAKKLAFASLKHRQIIEEEVMPLSPEDLKPSIIKSLDYSKNTYKTARDFLNSKGETPPKSPFND